ncbi:MAG: hypothetical protein AABW86_04110 [Candidatus Micrarchaeota archaeon]
MDPRTNRLTVTYSGPTVPNNFNSQTMINGLNTLGLTAVEISSTERGLTATEVSQAQPATEPASPEMAEIKVRIAGMRGDEDVLDAVHITLLGLFMEFDESRMESTPTGFTCRYLDRTRARRKRRDIEVTYTSATGELSVRGENELFEVSGFRQAVLASELEHYGLEIAVEGQRASMPASSAPARQEDTRIGTVTAFVAAHINLRDLEYAINVIIRVAFPEAGGRITLDENESCFTFNYVVPGGYPIAVSYNSETGRLSITTLQRRLDETGFTDAKLGFTLRWHGIETIDGPRAAAQAQMAAPAQPVLQSVETKKLEVRLGRVPTDADVHLIAKRFFEQRFNLRQDADGRYKFVSYNYEGNIRLDSAARRIIIEFHARMPGVRCPTIGEMEAELVRSSKTSSITIQVRKQVINPANVVNLISHFFPNLAEAERTRAQDETKGEVVIVKFRPKNTTTPPTLKVIFYMGTGEVAIVGSQEHIDVINLLRYDSITGRSVDGKEAARTLLSTPPKVQEKPGQSGQRRESWQTEMERKHPDPMTIKLPGPTTRDDLVAFSMHFLSGFSREEMCTAGARVSCLWTKGLARVMAVADIATKRQIMLDQLPGHAKEIVVHSNDPSVLERIRSEGEKFTATRARPGQQAQKPDTTFRPPQVQQPPPTNIGEYKRQFSGGSGGIQ